MKHLLVAVSAHGFGHLAQVAPVLNRLRELRPELRITLRSALARERLAGRIAGPFAHDPQADDFGMQQQDALTVDTAASARAYQAFHSDWPQRVASTARALEARAPDLILADVPYLTLAAAAQAQIPSIAMSVLNWADIFWHYHHALPEAGRIHAEMLAAYHGAEVFLKTEPAMPMPQFRHAEPVGPVVAPGRERRRHIDAHFALHGDERLVLVGLGGIAMRLPVEGWPRLPKLRYLVQRDWGIRREDVLIFDELGLPFSDILASCDAFITKPGYGSFTEAAVNGIPVLYVPRADWPEQPYLCAWLSAHAHCRSIEPEALMQGRFGEALEAVLALGRYRPIAPSGVEACCERIIRQLEQR